MIWSNHTLLKFGLLQWNKVWMTITVVFVELFRHFSESVIKLVFGPG